MCLRIANPSQNINYESLVKPKENIASLPKEEKVIETSKQDTRIENKEKEGKVSGAGIEFVEAPNSVPEISSVGNNSAQRTVGLVYKSIAESAINLTSNTLIKGVSIGIPFTSKSIGFGVQHEVAKDLQETFKELTQSSVKSSSSTIVSATKEAGQTQTKKAIESLIANGDVGKGVQTQTMKEASKASGGVGKAITNSYKELKSDLAASNAVKDISKEALPTLSKSTVNSIVQKAASEVSEEIAKTPNMTGAILGDFTKKVFNTLVEKEVQKIASQKGVQVSKEALKSIASDDHLIVVSKKLDILAKNGLTGGQKVKPLSKKAIDSITTQIAKICEKESTKTANKIVDNAVSKASKATMLGVSKEIAVGASDKALKKGVTEGIQAGVEKALKRSGGDVSEKLVSKAGESLIQKSVSYGAHEGIYGALVKQKLTTTIGTGIAKYGTAVGHVANGAILAMDSHDAYKKIKDPNVSLTSKTLATTTVGLDIASMALDKKYKPLAWVSSGLGIATSIGSDLTK